MRSCVSTGILILFLLLAVGNLWAADESDSNDITENGDSQRTNMQSWQEEWRGHEKKSGWTWFGMGYESRRGSSDSHPGGPTNGRGGNSSGANSAGGGGKRR